MKAGLREGQGPRDFRGLGRELKELAGDLLEMDGNIPRGCNEGLSRDWWVRPRTGWGLPEVVWELFG